MGWRGVCMQLATDDHDDDDYGPADDDYGPADDDYGPADDYDDDYGPADDYDDDYGPADDYDYAAAYLFECTSQSRR